jgi:nucleotide-binding universal stress UspA family protein
MTRLDLSSKNLRSNPVPTEESSAVETKEKKPRVVVGIDGSPQCKQALRWATQLATASGAELEVVMAWDYPTSYGWTAVPANWNPEGDTEKIVNETIDEVFGANRPANIRIAVCRGGAAETLLQAAKGSAMVVLGSRGHGGFSGLLLGSVSASVAEHATCPVLVVHGDAGPLELTS